MDKLRHLIENSRRTEKQVQNFLNLLLRKKLPCVSFIGQTESNILHKVCTVHKDGHCSKNCDVLKSPLVPTDDPQEKKDKLIEKEFSKKFKYTLAGLHFNKVIDVLDSEIGPLVVLEYEDSYIQHFTTLGDIVRFTEIDAKSWKIINFQFIASIASAQKVLEGFTHNDTHLSNILLVPNYKNVKISYKTNKRTLKNLSPFLVKIIDFEQALAKSPKFQTSVGKEIWKPLVWQNKMIDFFRFAFWSIYMLSVRENDGRKLPSWYQSWLDFVLRWLDSRFFLLGKDPYAQAQFIEIDPAMGKKPTREGGAWLQYYYGPHSKYIQNVGDLLNDSYFNDLVN